MKAFLRNNHRLIFYFSWLILGLIQSSFTQLEDDEAYYWVCSKFLDWGYFDHPPMIALMIKAGYAFFHSELGVRLFSLLANTISILLIEKLVRPKNPRLFYAIVLSVAVLQTSGFLAVPDAPLILFTALFFLLYRRFVQSAGSWNIILLGIGTALLLYSKYHGVLVVAFTLLSNLKLFRRYPIYISGLIAIVCYLPHLYWQYTHDWASIQYHLFERIAPAYKLSFTLDYLGGQLLITGPIAGFILIPACLLYQARNKTEKALRFTFIGIFLFFLLNSFRGRIEANWTAPVVVPLLVISYLYIESRKRWRLLIFRTLPVTLALVFLVRAAMIVDFLPLRIVKARYHSWKNWPALMNEKTKGLPIVFSNSLQRASKYWFYTGQMAYSQNEYRDRRNNYNFWPVEDSLLGKAIYFLDIYQLYRFPDSLKTPLGDVGYWYDSSFSSFAKIQFNIEQIKNKINNGQPVMLHVNAAIPPHYSSFIISNPGLVDTTRIGLFDKNGWIRDVYTPLHLKDWNSGRSFTLNFDPGLPAGKYYMRMAINIRNYNPTHNSAKIPLVIE